MRDAGRWESLDIADSAAGLKLVIEHGRRFD